MIQSKNKNNTNWRMGLITTFAIAAFTASITNYAVWEQDVLSDYTYTDDNIAIDDALWVGFSTSNSVDPQTLVGDGDIIIYDAVPVMTFVDSSNTNDPSWQIGQVSNADDINITWRGDLDSTGGSTPVTQHVVTLESNSPADSIQTFASGDVSLAGGDVYWDNTQSILGIGTSTPGVGLLTGQALHVKSSFAVTVHEANGATWWDETNSQGHWLGQLAPNFRAGILKLQNDALANSIVADATGVGLGTAVPAASLEVERSDGTAKILVDENSATTEKRRLMELENNGAASMLFTNSNTGVQWELNPNSNDHFIINSVGIGGTELTIKNDTGEMFVGGRIRTNDNIVTTSGQVVAQGVILTSSRDTKEAFKPVDNTEILDKVAGLEITQWRFKEGNEQQQHIGPMAEDFEEAFQLGTDGKTIGVTDMNGVTLASIQALDAKDDYLLQKLEEKNKLITVLSEQNRLLMQRLDRLEKAIQP